LRRARIEARMARRKKRRPLKWKGGGAGGRVRRANGAAFAMQLAVVVPLFAAVCLHCRGSVVAMPLAAADGSLLCRRD